MTDSCRPGFFATFGGSVPLSSQGARTMKYLLLAIVICMSAGDVAQTAQRASPYQFYADLRTFSCYSWTPLPPIGQPLDRDELSRHAPVHAWIYGYLAGAGYMPSAVNGERMTSIDIRLVDAWMDGYCAEHPSGTVEGSIRTLLKELDARRSTGR